MFFIIDGTGCEDDDEYHDEMRHGFCFNLYLKINGFDLMTKSLLGGDGPKGFYHRGPLVSGIDTFDIAEKMLKDNILPFLNKRKANGSLEDIYLAGHSRGGAAVIYIAYRLLELKTNVKAMFLFDAVDRTINGAIILARETNKRLDIGLLNKSGIISTKSKNTTVYTTNKFDLQTIPMNVANCYHAMRNTTITDYYPEDHGIDYYHLSNQMKSIMRSRAGVFETPDYSGSTLNRLKNRVTSDWQNLDFENCGKVFSPGCSHINKWELGCEGYIERFLCSHGAVGGASAVVNAVSKARKENKIVKTDFDKYGNLVGQKYDLLHKESAGISSVNSWMSENLHKEGILAGRNIIG